MNTIPKTITGTIGAYLMTAFYGPEELAGDAERAINVLSFFSHEYKGSDYTKVGTAKITVELVSQDEMLGNQIDALKSEKTKLMADHQQALTNIDSKIQQLLAITMTAAA